MRLQNQLKVETNKGIAFALVSITARTHAGDVSFWLLGGLQTCYILVLPVVLDHGVVESKNLNRVARL